MIEYISPPDNEADKVYECYFCDSAIYEGEDCINKHFKIIAEKPDMEGYLANLEYHDTNIISQIIQLLLIKTVL